MKLDVMKEKFLTGLFALMVVFGSIACSSGDDSPTPVEEDNTPIRIATYNVRYNSSTDGDNAWIYRRDRVAEIIRIHNFDIFGAQEPYYEQLSDITRLSPNYAYVGLSRTGQAESGEFAPIFYHKDRIEILESGQFWLTEKDRTQPNTGWDAAQPRICVWAKVRHKIADKTFYVFNTHFDHIGTQAREESAKLLLELVPEMAGNLPFFLIGDFNFDQTHGNYSLLKNSTALSDTYDIAREKINANRGTLNSFNPNNTSTGRIDHIFVNRKNTPTILKHQIITDSYYDSRTEMQRVASDHFPVMVDVKF